MIGQLKWVVWMIGSLWELKWVWDECWRFILHCSIPWGHYSLHLIIRSYQVWMLLDWWYCYEIWQVSQRPLCGGGTCGAPSFIFMKKKAPIYQERSQYLRSPMGWSSLPPTGKNGGPLTKQRSTYWPKEPLLKNLSYGPARQQCLSNLRAKEQISQHQDLLRTALVNRAYLSIMAVFPGIGIPILTWMRQSHECLIFKMRIFIALKMIYLSWNSPWINSLGHSISLFDHINILT